MGKQDFLEELLWKQNNKKKLKRIQIDGVS